MVGASVFVFWDGHSSGFEQHEDELDIREQDMERLVACNKQLQDFVSELQDANSKLQFKLDESAELLAAMKDGAANKLVIDNAQLNEVIVQVSEFGEMGKPTEAGEKLLLQMAAEDIKTIAKLWVVFDDPELAKLHAFFFEPFLVVHVTELRNLVKIAYEKVEKDITVTHHRFTTWSEARSPTQITPSSILPVLFPDSLKMKFASEYCAKESSGKIFFKGNWYKGWMLGSNDFVLCLDMYGEPTDPDHLVKWSKSSRKGHLWFIAFDSKKHTTTFTSEDLASNRIVFACNKVDGQVTIEPAESL